MADTDDMARFAEQVARRLAIPRSALVGCSDDELAEIQGLVFGGGPVVTAYMDFMRYLGRSAEIVFRGSGVHYPEVLAIPEVVADLREGGDRFTDDGKFIFGTHQGYQLYYFRSTGSRDAAVWLHSEGSEADEMMRPSFVELVWSCLRNSR